MFFDIICPECGEEIFDFSKSIKDPFPLCKNCTTQMKKNWKSNRNIPCVVWNGPGGSLAAGRPSKRSYNTNESEVEETLYRSINEEDDD